MLAGLLVQSSMKRFITLANISPRWAVVHNALSFVHVRLTKIYESLDRVNLRETAVSKSANNVLEHRSASKFVATLSHHFVVRAHFLTLSDR